MEEAKFNFWQKWLTCANAITLIVGLLLAFAGNSFVFKLHNSYTENVFFNSLPITGDMLQFKNWLFGIIGATIAGFHLLMIFISENAFKKKEKWAYQAMLFALLLWFVIDSGISICTGAIYNVVLINLVALFLIGLPLVMTRKAFLK